MVPLRGYNFSAEVRFVLAEARKIAVRLGHDAVGQEHLLLALTAPGQDRVRAVLAQLGADTDAVHREAESRLTAHDRPDEREEFEDRQLPYTQNAKKTLEFTMMEVRDMDHHTLGVEHLASRSGARRRSDAARRPGKSRHPRGRTPSNRPRRMSWRARSRTWYPGARQCAMGSEGVMAEVGGASCRIPFGIGAAIALAIAVYAAHRWARRRGKARRAVTAVSSQNLDNDLSKF